MDYRLIVLDVDGTLLNSNHEMTERTRSTLLKVQQTGIKLALSSGRPPEGLVSIAKQMELDVYGGYGIAYNGAELIDYAQNKTVFERRIKAEVLVYLEKQAEKEDCAIFTYRDGSVIAKGKSVHIDNEARLNGLEVKEVEDFAAAVDFDPSKVVVVSDDEDCLLQLSAKLQRRLNGVAEVHPSEDYFLEVLPYGIDKSAGVAVLLERMGIKAREMAAFGDGVRDVGVLQMAGLSVAMGNARTSVRSCAEQVTLSNDRDGVAAAIEKAVFAEIQAGAVPLEQLNRQTEATLMGTLGITYTYVAAERVEATMPVNKHTRQPFGVLHGGATLALAETVAGIGSIMLAKPDEHVLGMQVSGNHVATAHEGDTVRAVATVIHAGRRTHVWNVDVFTSTGKLVSSVRVVNSVTKKG